MVFCILKEDTFSYRCIIVLLLKQISQLHIEVMQQGLTSGVSYPCASSRLSFEEG